MSKRTKIWLVIGASLVILGLIMFAAVMSLYHWDITKLSAVEYETNTYGINEEFSDISIVVDTADVVLVSSENAKSSVVCYEQKNAKHLVAVKDGTFVIEAVNTKNGMNI